MKILVTGGAGFIASHVVDAYITQGHEVVVPEPGLIIASPYGMCRCGENPRWFLEGPENRDMRVDFFVKVDTHIYSLRFCQAFSPCFATADSGGSAASTSPAARG